MTLACDAIAGCDGFHGVCRDAMAQQWRGFDRAYPFGWLGILAEAAPSSEELIYANHERGFALASMRSPSVSRYYLQCAPDENLDAWSDGRIWDELERRLASPGFTLTRGLTHLIPSSGVAEASRAPDALPRCGLSSRFQNIYVGRWRLAELGGFRGTLPRASGCGGLEPARDAREQLGLRM